MQKRAVIGLDVSLVSTGVAIRTSDGAAVRVTAVSTPKKSAPTDLCRQRLILARVSELLDELEGYERHVFFEDYAFSSFTGKAFTRAELVGMLKLRAAEAGCAVYTVGISALKRYISGKGNASKEEMCAAAASRWGFVYSGVGKKKDDIVDAFCLTCLGEGYLSSPGALTGVAQSCPPTTAPDKAPGAAASARLGAVPMTVLTKQGWEELCADIENPPAPNDALKRLFVDGSARLLVSGGFYVTEDLEAMVSFLKEHPAVSHMLRLAEPLFRRIFSAGGAQLCLEVDYDTGAPCLGVHVECSALIDLTFAERTAVQEKFFDEVPDNNVVTEALRHVLLRFEPWRAMP